MDRLKVYGSCQGVDWRYMVVVKGRLEVCGSCQG